MYSRSLPSREKATYFFLNDVERALQSQFSSVEPDLVSLLKYVADGDTQRFLADFAELRRTLDFYSKSRKRSEDAYFVRELCEFLEEFDYIEARWGAYTHVKVPLENAFTKLWNTLYEALTPPKNYHFNSQMDMIFSEMRRELTPFWGARSASEISISRLVEIVTELDELVATYGDDEYKEALESFHKEFDQIEAKLMVLELVDA